MSEKKNPGMSVEDTVGMSGKINVGISVKDNMVPALPRESAKGPPGRIESYHEVSDYSTLPKSAPPSKRISGPLVRSWLDGKTEK